jgi:lipopolysaccharide export system protein LptA
MFFYSVAAMAIPEDNEADIHITADKFTYNHETGIATYIGNVLAVQGTRQLTGDEMQVYRLADGEIEKIITIGEQAKYQAITDPNKPMLHARADTIIFEVTEDYLTLIEDAHVKQGGDEYESPLIEYDTLRKIVKSPQSEQGRTTIILQPKEDS